uniref:Uncharacterized protein n=1 Tax=Vitrella brassicaformis TaxID=1169539 RepID=A0A7S1K2D2_9ALVE
MWRDPCVRRGACASVSACLAVLLSCAFSTYPTCLSLVDISLPACLQSVHKYLVGLAKYLSNVPLSLRVSPIHPSIHSSIHPPATHQPRVIHSHSTDASCLSVYGRHTLQYISTPTPTRSTGQHRT